MLRRLGGPLDLCDGVEVVPPRFGEVQVRMAATGVCHSDLSMRDGVLPMPLPAVLGHEGAGIIERVGDGVTGLAPGDHVVISWVPQCRSCFFCCRGQPQLCVQADAVLFSGGLLDGTPRLRLDGADLFQMEGVGTFTESTVIPAIGAVKVPSDLDLSVAALLGCAVLTGVGAALNTARIRPGDSVVVIGCGGVGLNVVQGARIAQAERIVAVDIHASKLDLAARLGATDLVDATAGDPVAAVRDLTGQRGADVAFEAIGSETTIHQAVEMTRRGGQCVLVGLPGLETMISLPALLGVILAEKSISGCWFGSADIRRDIPRLVEMYRAGQLKLDELVSRRVTLDQVNEAFTAMTAGEVARTVIVY
ncbi:MAG: zinc-binding dehydrogenase [Acidimicrobiales bacterium]